LSATIHFHFGNHVKDKTLAAGIVSNLYKDNLIVSAITTTEGLHKYKCLKSIFNDLKMNPRAFLSNNLNIIKAISAPDRSSKTSPEVLGQISVVRKVQIQREETISESTTAQQIASVYDLFVLFIPLFVKTKHFQHPLWKHHYDWEEPLSEKHKQQ
uniref:WS_DGAT_C domain-containing protein n=1 Tax=Haemonchus placei TaxID=6290 RepID=A0A0N4WA59_HAEPC